MQYRYRILISVCLLATFLLPGLARALEPCSGDIQPAAQIVSAQGKLEIKPGKHRARQIQVLAVLNDYLCPDDTVSTGSLGRAAIVILATNSVLRIDQNTQLWLPESKQEKHPVIDLLRGIIHFFSREPYLLDVATPFVNGTIEGTEFLVDVQNDHATINVLEGTVRAWNSLGEVTLGRDEIAFAAKGTAPLKRVSLRPLDAVQWSLYYPPAFAFLGGASAEVPGNMPPRVRSAMLRAAEGDLESAENELEDVAETDRNADYYLYRAALGLHTGRVDEAVSDIEAALRLDPNAGLAYALRAIIEIVRNEPERGFDNATRGVELSATAAAKIALSYAQQAQFQIEAARDTLKEAVTVHPEDPLVWARLSELWLMLGNSRESRATAQKAAELAPNLARAQLALGYAELAEFRNADAVSAFERAIAMDSADPLAHLGLGLARINAGDLAHGRRNLEVAVSLDATNALLRAYLGKGYFEERRYPLDSQQYDIAKRLDPNGPTAYLYDGILKQTVNRPIEAIEDIRESVRLNDNRAVYRSRLLLDEDRAARGTSLALAYRDLDFTQLGINQSTKSLALDPADASAHRFLSDTYLGLPRFDIARVSELLQAQLMQDINVNPVQPSLAETNLNIVTLGGPSRASFNEFTPLFQRNKTQFNASGIAGNNDTYGGEAVVSGVHNRISYSMGVFAYDTDGWRPNNDLQKNLANIYLQGAISPEVNLQVEIQHQDSEEGDLALQFDPNDVALDKRREFDRDSARLGLRYSPQPHSPRSTFLLSYIYSDTNEKLREADQLDPLTSFSLDSDRNTKGGMVEGQYIYQRERLGLVIGAAYSNPDTVIDENLQFVDVNIGPVFSEEARIEEKIEHPRAYAYANIHTGAESVDWTIGASYDDFKDEPIEKTSFNPKFGVRWQLNPNWVIRAAGFKVIKPSFINNRTIEPTQVAGFNQFFDDLPGTASWRYGAAVDWQSDNSLSAGVELSWRDLDEPAKVRSRAEARFDEQHEQLHRLYLYWTPTDRVAVNTALIYDRYEGQGPAVQFGPRPEDVETLSLPLSLTYIDPNGFFATLGGTYVDQKVRRAQDSQFSDGDDSFFVVDAAVGYRLPKRRGLVSLAVKNLFDEEFMFQDNSFREFSEEAVISPFIPSRIIIGRVTLSF